MQNLDGVGRVYYGGFKNSKYITSKGLEARIKLLLNLLMEYTIPHGYAFIWYVLSLSAV